MSRLFKKWGILIISVFFILVFVILGALSMVTINKYKDALEDRDSQIYKLEASLNNIGPLTTGFVVTKDVRAGELIEEDYITAVDIPEVIGRNISTSIDDLVGKYYRISLSEGTVLTKEDVVSEVIDNTERKYDLILEDLPIGLEVGDYIDVRIRFPYGQDFVAMSNKKVIDINSGVPKIYVSEADILAYNSMLLDTVMHNGVMYALEYKDAGSQAGAEVFYPVNNDIASLIEINPNILEIVRDKMKLERKVLDNAMGGTINEKDEREFDRLMQQYTQVQNQLKRTKTQSQNEWQRRMERAAAEAARAAQ